MEFFSRMLDPSGTALRAGSSEKEVAHYAALAAALSEFFYAARPEGTREYFGPDFCRYTGFAAGAANGDGWLDAVHPDDRERVREHFLSCLRENRSFIGQYRCRSADGGHRRFVDRCSPAPDAACPTVAWYGVCTDVEDLPRDRQAPAAADRESSSHPGERDGIEEREQLAGADSSSILTALLDLYCWLGPDGTVLRYHAGCSSIFPDGEIVNRRIQDLVAPAVARQIEDALRQVARGAEVVEFEFRSFVGDDERWYNGRVLPLPGSSELLVVRDITKKKRAEEGFRQVVEWAPIGMILVDRDGAINLVNSQAERLFGYRREELIGQPIEILLPARYRAGHPTQRQGYFTNPVARPMWSGRDLTGLRKGGSEFPVEIGLNPLPGKHGGMVLASIIDITEWKRSSIELAARVEELARSNAELQQFAYIASHDLQEPLRMVASYLELLAKRYAGQLDERADKFIRYAVDGATRMQSLIDDLLVYSRVGTKGVAPVPVDCREVFRQVVANLGPRVAATGATVTCDELPTVPGDPVQLAQLFQNLIGNALKFCEGAERRGGDWRFTVRDNGIGIAPEHYERIFQIFQRLHTRANYSGTGIGLAICRKVVERHGGRISVEPAPGGGSEFSFTLPVKGNYDYELLDGPKDR